MEQGTALDEAVAAIEWRAAPVMVGLGQDADGQAWTVVLHRTLLAQLGLGLADQVQEGLFLATARLEYGLDLISAERAVLRAGANLERAGEPVLIGAKAMRRNADFEHKATLDRQRLHHQVQRLGDDGVLKHRLDAQRQGVRVAGQRSILSEAPASFLDPDHDAAFAAVQEGDDIVDEIGLGLGFAKIKPGFEIAGLAFDQIGFDQGAGQGLHQGGPGVGFRVSPSSRIRCSAPAFIWSSRSLRIIQ